MSQGTGPIPPGLAEACGIEWDYDAYATDASDDHQYGSDAGGGTGEDMDVAGEDSDGSDDSDTNTTWELPRLEIARGGYGAKAGHPHLHQLQ